MFKLHPWPLACVLVLAPLLSAPAAHAAELASVQATSAAASASSSFDGVVEALRQTVVAAQVPGAVVELPVKVGDRVAVMHAGEMTATQAAQDWSREAIGLAMAGVAAHPGVHP